MAPAVFIRKKSVALGWLLLCLSTRNLETFSCALIIVNWTRGQKIAYLLSCPDERHDQIVDVLYFLQNTCRMAGYWQLSVIQLSTQRQHSHSSRLGNLPVSQHAFVAGDLSSDEQVLSWVTLCHCLLWWHPHPFYHCHTAWRTPMLCVSPHMWRSAALGCPILPTLNASQPKARNLILRSLQYRMCSLQKR